MDNLRRADLNLLILFQVLYEEKNVSKAANRLNLTQSAISHALKRLRDQFNDVLFTRSDKGFIPTEKAKKISKGVMKFIHTLQEEVFNEKEFQSKEITRTFKIATTDLIEATIGLKIISIFEKEAPNSKISFIPTTPRFPSHELANGQIDLAIAGFFKNVPESFYKKQLIESKFLCAVKKNHPRIKTTMNENDYFNEKHILVAPGGNLKTESDKNFIKSKKKKREFSASVSSFLASGWLLENSNSILTGPDFLIDLLIDRFKVKKFQVPVNMKKIKIDQFWHERSHYDQEHIWFRSVIKRAIIINQ